MRDRSKNRVSRVGRTREEERELTFVNWVKQSKKPLGSSTCSMTSIEQTTSNCLPSLINSSAGICLYCNLFFPVFPGILILDKEGEEEEEGEAGVEEGILEGKGGGNDGSKEACD